jgi:hypothetical protein
MLQLPMQPHPTLTTHDYTDVLQADEVRRRVEAGRERERNALLQKLQEEEELLRKRMADEVCSAALLQFNHEQTACATAYDACKHKHLLPQPSLSVKWLIDRWCSVCLLECMI